MAVVGNISRWRLFRKLGPARRTSLIDVTSKPVRHRPAAYLTTGLFAVLLGLVAAAPQSTIATPSRSITQDELLQALNSPTANPEATGPKHDQIQSLTAFLAGPPRGWSVLGKDVVLSLDRLSKLFKDPPRIAADLSITGFVRGVNRVIYQKSPRKVAAIELWQFAAPAGAEAFFQDFLKGNAPHPGSIYRTETDTSSNGHLFLAGTRDKYGFAFGVGVRRVGDLIVHVRFSSLSEVKAADVSSALDRACSAVISSPSAV
jgi:hypothetical protein